MRRALLSLFLVLIMVIPSHAIKVCGKDTPAKISGKASPAKVNGKAMLAYPSGLQALYNFENNLNDSSGNGNTLAATIGTAAYSTDYKKWDTYSADFSSDSYTRNTSSASFPGEAAYTACTIIAWLRPTDITQAFYVFSMINNGFRISPGLYVNATGHPVLRIDNTSGTTYEVTAGTALTDDDWNLIAATWDGSNLRIYRWTGSEFSSDATPVAFSGTADSSSSYTLTVGSWGSLFYFPGQLDALAIFNSALSLTQLNSWGTNGPDGGGW